jgi:hypothetical protein
MDQRVIARDRTTKPVPRICRREPNRRLMRSSHARHADPLFSTWCPLLTSSWLPLFRSKVFSRPLCRLTTRPGGRHNRRRRHVHDPNVTVVTTVTQELEVCVHRSAYWRTIIIGKKHPPHETRKRNRTLEGRCLAVIRPLRIHRPRFLDSKGVTCGVAVDDSSQPGICTALAPVLGKHDWVHARF